jgi:hypothetical protein
LLGLLREGTTTSELIKASGGPLADLLSMPSDVGNLSDADIAGKWFGKDFSPEKISQLRGQATAQGIDFRSALLYQKLDPAAMSKHTEENQDTKRAGLLVRLAQIVSEIEKRPKDSK